MATLDAVEGLRERKKRERRALIAATALRLFDEQGYGATTVAEIARAADVSPRTVSLYFPAKEDLVFAGSEETQERLEQAFRARAEGETFGDAMRRWLVDEIERRWENADEARIQRKLVAAEPALKAAELRHRERVHEAVAHAIAEDFALADALDAQMVAAATIASFEAIGARVGRESDAGKDPMQTEVLPLFDRALLFVRGGMDALDEGSPHPRRRGARTPST